MAHSLNASAQGLYWVKQELAVSLRQVRDYVEAYLEAPANSLPLQRAMVELHQIRGTLRMVQCEGAALLAEEMKDAVHDLLRELDSAPEKAFEVLLGSTLQLSDYLDLVLAGESDNALIFLPIINELRVSRGAGVVSESALFINYASRLAHITPELDLSTRAEQGAQIVARQRLNSFQVALLRVLKDQDTTVALERLANVAQTMAQTTCSAQGYRLFTAMDALICALTEGSVDVELEIKRHLGRVGQHLKNAAEMGDQALQEIPDALLYGLVYFAGRTPSENPKIKDLRSNYALNELLPERDTLERLRAHLRGPNTSLVTKLSAEIRDDIGKVKDSIDLVIRAGDKASVDLKDTAEITEGVADTLGMLGLDMLKRVVANQAQAILTLAHTGARDQDAWMDVALALLRVEQSLDSALFQHLHVPGAADRREELAPHQDIVAATHAIYREALINISRIKSLIPDYIDQAEAGLLREAAHLLHEVEAGLQIIDLDEGVEVLAHLRGFINSGAMAHIRRNPHSVLLLADAIASVEYYLEGLVSANPGADKGVFDAQHYVQQLAEKHSQPHEEPEPLHAAQDSESQQDPERLDVSADDLGSGLTPNNIEPDQADAHLPDMGDFSVEDSEKIVGLEPVVGYSDDIEIDPEIRAIFLEEAQEVLAQLQDDVPAWSSNVEDAQGRLSDIRRAFHTLKGSGRMVGAAHLSEFGWSLEYLLNRCLEHAVAITSQVIAVVQNAVVVLPELIDDFKAEREPDNMAVVALADSLSGRIAEAAQSGQSQAHADSELYRIFRGDTLKHIDTLRNYSEQYAPCRVNPDLVRAMHTLKGSAAAVHAPDISRLAGALEQFSDTSRAAQRPLEEDALSLLGEAAEVFAARVRELDEAPSGEPTDVQDILQRLAVLSADLPQAAVEESSDRKLVIIFTDEACDLLDEIELGLVDWQATPSDEYHPRQIKALCHKLKGSARTSEAGVMANVVQALEDKVGDHLRDSQIPDNAEFGRLRDVVDGLYDFLDRYRHGDRTGDAQPLLALLGVDESEQPPDSSDANTDLAAASDLQEDSVDEQTASPELEAFEPEADPDSHQSAQDISQAELEAQLAAQAKADAELVSIFIEEADELLTGVREQVEFWVKDQQNEQPRLALMRYLHTLKGSARMAGVNAVGDLSHELETLVAAARTPARRADADVLSNLTQQADQLYWALDAARKAHEAPSEARNTSSAQTLQIPPISEDDTGELQAPSEVSQTQSPQEFDPRLYWQAEVEEFETTGQEETARIGVNQLQTLLNQAGEISIFRARLEQQTTGLQFQLRELAQTTGRLREQLRTLDAETEAQIMARHEATPDRYDEEFDPLEMDRYSTLHELSRGLAESVTDIGSLHGFISDLVDQGEVLLGQQARVNTSLQQGLMRTLMVPFSLQIQRLQRILRQVANDHDRRADITFSGEEAELDRNVLQRMAAPLEHLLRNAIIHGLEDPQERIHAGKNEVGTVSVNLRREGTQLVIAMRDDGRGLDLDAIRRTAASRQLLREGDPISDEDLAAFIFEPGFSTATELSQDAGRGVGLDVVNAQIKQLGGSMTVDSEPDKGACFTIRLPLTLAITQALMVRVGEETYAVPIAGVEGVTRVTSDVLSNYIASGSADFLYGGLNYQMRNLGDILGSTQSNLEADSLPPSLPVLLVRSGDRRTAYLVDGMLASREVIVKPVGPQVSTVPGISGATMQADGQVILILDVAALMHLQTQLQARQASDDNTAIDVIEQTSQVSQVMDDRPLVMVVDDSITIRRVSERLLSRSGMRVVTAKDGMDAMAKLQSNIPDAMLLDIEMPRIDGFELATYMRNSDELKNTPIIMITSRSGDKHRRRAEQIGVNKFMTKPYQDQDLLQQLYAVMRNKPASAH